MAKLYVTEFGGIAPSGMSISVAPPIVDQTPVVIGAGSLQSAAFNAATVLVRIHTDAICSIAFGTNPTASANTMRLAAGATEYFATRFGHKVAVITNS
jgi:hypothetical protein